MKTKGFSFGRVKQRRDRLYAQALRPYLGARIVGDTIPDMCADIGRVLPQTVSRDALFESLRVMAGTTLTRKEAMELAWRLAGNVDRLSKSERVLPWTRQVDDEIVPVRVERIHADKKRDTEGFTLYCRALAGSPCPLIFPQFFSYASCRAISRTLGFSATWGAYPLKTPLYFMGLMFFAHIEADKSGDMPYFKQVSGSSGLIEQNKPKIEVRCRAKPCPRGYQHDCEKCWLGQEVCPAAIYAKSLVRRECAQCANMGFFEPDDDGTTCLNCKTAHRR